MVACTLSRLLFLLRQTLFPFCTSFAPNTGSKGTLLLRSGTLEDRTDARLLNGAVKVGQNALPLTVALAVLVWQLILSMVA